MYTHNMKTGIYKIISPSGKVYIGQSINIEKRKKQYIKLDKTCIGPKLYNSLIKYGFNNHIFEIIEECSIGYLDEKEVYWKQYYLNINKNNWEMVLFCEIYDKGGGPKSSETKLKQSISQKINLSKPEVKEKRKINCKIAANRPGVQEKAVKNTDWEKRELNRLKNTDYTKMKKPVIQFDLEGNIIREWGGFVDVKNTLKYDPSAIRKCCVGKIKTAYGYVWKYK
jgi:group I intron endonuclease